MSGAPYVPELAVDPIDSRRLAERVNDLGDQINQLAVDHQHLADAVGLGPGPKTTFLEVFNGYMPVAIVAFLVTLIATPLMRRLAVANGVIDRPSDPRKVHRVPIAYLGGAAVYLGLMAGMIVSYLGITLEGVLEFHPSDHVASPFETWTAGVPDVEERMGSEFRTVPLSVLLGMTVICIVGLVDDVAGISPRLKLGGQLFAAAALALDNVGVQVAAGAVLPLAQLLGIPTIDIQGHETVGFIAQLPFEVPLLGETLEFDVIYWIGTATIAAFVLGACNASNLIDGLDGLLSGVTAIAGMGLLVVAISLAVQDDGPRDAQRLIMCLALIGACLGFLPHNFNPATIFLGDCGSLLLGFITITIVLSLGDTGKTHLVLAGLIIYGVPIIDTMLAIARRKLAGQKMSDPDKNHLHHMLSRALNVKGAVLTLYGFGILFGAIGVAMSESRARVTYGIALLFASWIVVYSIKIARRSQIEAQAAAYDARAAGGTPTPPPDAASGARPDPISDATQDAATEQQNSAAAHSGPDAPPEATPETA